MYTESSLEGFWLVHTPLENGLFATLGQGMYTKTTVYVSFAVQTRYVHRWVKLIPPARSDEGGVWGVLSPMSRRLSMQFNEKGAVKGA